MKESSSVTFVDESLFLILIKFLSRNVHLLHVSMYLKW